MRMFTKRMLLMGVFLLALAGPCAAQLKINEVYYDVSPQDGNQYVELYNAGTNTAYLDGLVLTDEGGSGNEGVFQFPGGVGGTNHPVTAGGRVMVAVDAIGATSNADWECFAGGFDSNNVAVPDLVRVGGSFDLSLFSAGDNVILANGSDTNAPIDQSTVIDGMNFANGGGELAPLSSSASETDGSANAGPGFSLSRCGDGVDNDGSSAGDFFARTITPNAANNCVVPSFVINDVSLLEGQGGTTSAVFIITLTASNPTPVSVNYATANGTATAGVDYVAISSTTLVFNAGVTAQTIFVTVNGDTTPETNETFFVNLQLATNAVIADSQGVGTILDDDTVIFTSQFTRIAGPATAVTTTWTAVSGKTYQLQFASNVVSQTWVDLGGVVTAVSTTASAVDTSTPTIFPRIYRIRHLD